MSFVSLNIIIIYSLLSYIQRNQAAKCCVALLDTLFVLLFSDDMMAMLLKCEGDQRHCLSSLLQILLDLVKVNTVRL